MAQAPPPAPGPGAPPTAQNVSRPEPQGAAALPLIASAETGDEPAVRAPAGMYDPGFQERMLKEAAKRQLDIPGLDQFWDNFPQRYLPFFWQKIDDIESISSHPELQQRVVRDVAALKVYFQLRGQKQIGPEKYADSMFRQFTESEEELARSQEQVARQLIAKSRAENAYRRHLPPMIDPKLKNLFDRMNLDILDGRSALENEKLERQRAEKEHRDEMVKLRDEQDRLKRSLRDERDRFNEMLRDKDRSLFVLQQRMSDKISDTASVSSATRDDDETQVSVPQVPVESDSESYQSSYGSRGNPDTG